jgi:hypothetical protein
LKNCPWYGGREVAAFESSFVAQRSLQTETTRDIWMAHKFLLISSEVAIDRQCTIHLADKCCLSLFEIVSVISLFESQNNGLTW